MLQELKLVVSKQIRSKHKQTSPIHTLARIEDSKSILQFQYINQSFPNIQNLKRSLNSIHVCWQLVGSMVCIVIGILGMKQLSRCLHPQVSYPIFCQFFSSLNNDSVANTINQHLCKHRHFSEDDLSVPDTCQTLIFMDTFGTFTILSNTSTLYNWFLVQILANTLGIFPNT